MRVIQLATIAATFLWLAAPPCVGAAPQVLPENPVCEASALCFVPCVGAASAQRCALVGDNEREEELYQYRVSPDGALVPADRLSLGHEPEAIRRRGAEALCGLLRSAGVRLRRPPVACCGKDQARLVERLAFLALGSRWFPHSKRRASMGSMRLARCAGTKPAKAATAVSMRMALPAVQGSPACTP